MNPTQEQFTLNRAASRRTAFRQQPRTMIRINHASAPRGATSALLALAALGFTGCATLQLPDFPERTVQQQPYRAIQDGLAVGVRPITDESEAKRYFGVDLLAVNILAVAVTVENRSADSGFILEKERFRLGDVALRHGLRTVCATGGEDPGTGDATHPLVPRILRRTNVTCRPQFSNH